MIWNRSNSGAFHARHEDGGFTLCGYLMAFRYQSHEALPAWARPCLTCLSVANKIVDSQVSRVKNADSINAVEKKQ